MASSLGTAICFSEEATNAFFPRGNIPGAFFSRKPPVKLELFNLKHKGELVHMKKEDFLIGFFVGVSLMVASIQDYISRKAPKSRSRKKLW